MDRPQFGMETTLSHILFDILMEHWLGHVNNIKLNRQHSLLTVDYTGWWHWDSVMWLVGLITLTVHTETRCNHRQNVHQSDCTYSLQQKLKMCSNRDFSQGISQPGDQRAWKCLGGWPFNNLNHLYLLVKETFNSVEPCTHPVLNKPPVKRSL